MVFMIWKMYKNENPISYRLWPHCVKQKKKIDIIWSVIWHRLWIANLVWLNSILWFSGAKKLMDFFSSWFLFCNRNLQSLFITPFFAISHHCAACCPEGFVFFFLQRNCFLERLSWYGCNTFDWMKGRVKAVLEFQGLTLENFRTHKIILLLVTVVIR